jgi:hypothetical protein
LTEDDFIRNIRNPFFHVNQFDGELIVSCEENSSRD